MIKSLGVYLLLIVISRSYEGQIEDNIPFAKANSFDMMSNDNYDLLKLPCESPYQPRYRLDLPEGWKFQNCKIHIPKSLRIPASETRGKTYQVEVQPDAGYYNNKQGTILISYRRKASTGQDGNLSLNKLYLKTEFIVADQEQIFTDPRG